MSGHEWSFIWIVVLVLNLAELLVVGLNGIILGMRVPFGVVCLHVGKIWGWNSSFSDEVFGHVSDPWLGSKDVIGSETVHDL